MSGESRRTWWWGGAMTPAVAAAASAAAARLARLAELPTRFGRWVQRPRWLVGFAVVALATLAVAAVDAALGGLHPGSVPGLFYGGLASALMLAAALLAGRRRSLRWSLGRVQTWVQVHVYGGTLFLLLVLMHAGFAWPRETLTRWLLGLSLWVVATGLVGVVLRKWIPRVLSSALTTEALFERIPELSREVAARAEAVAAAASPTVRDFHRKSLRRRLGTPRLRWVFLVDVTAGISSRLRVFDFLRQRLTAAERADLDRLEELLRAQLELDAHWTLQRPLRWWLWLHVPPSLVLVLLVALHVAAVTYY